MTYLLRKENHYWVDAKLQYSNPYWQTDKINYCIMTYKKKKKIAKSITDNKHDKKKKKNFMLKTWLTDWQVPFMTLSLLLNRLQHHLTWQSRQTGKTIFIYIGTDANRPNLLYESWQTICAQQHYNKTDVLKHNNMPTKFYHVLVGPVICQTID